MQGDFLINVHARLFGTLEQSDVLNLWLHRKNNEFNILIVVPKAKLNDKTKFT